MPEPDGPTRAVTVPGRSVSVTSSITGTSGRYPKVTPSNSIGAVGSFGHRLAITNHQLRLVERSLDTAGREHAALDSAEAVPDAEQTSPEGGAQQQEREQVDGVQRFPDHQRGADGQDQPQERRGPSHHVHRRLLADERPLPRHQEVDVLVEPAPERGRRRAAEDADDGLALKVGAGLAVHPLRPARSLHDLRT